MKVKTIKSYVISLMLVAIVAFGAGHNEIVDTLILVGVWILIGLGSLAAILMGFGIGVLAVVKILTTMMLLKSGKTLINQNGLLPFQWQLFG
ncbi:hypothetical protein LCGC14_1552150 [marine sediment metagenome]|uniref:Uncharacterized protein n=1 Tax=marine sediment metagenome TaxID=412755 RepID=A0A0F9IQ20_9ZZZZ